MRRWFWWALLVGVVVGVGVWFPNRWASASASAEGGTQEAVAIRFPDGLAASPGEFAVIVARAQGRIDRFAAEYGWESLTRPLFYRSVEIFRHQQSFFRRVRALSGTPADAPLPPTAVAGLEGGVLVAVCPEEYARAVPDYAAETNSYEKLLAHEIAHRLHIRILNGNEEAMGPPWFYEGFAVVASGQLDRGPISEDEIESAMKFTSYVKFGALVRYFMKKAPLPGLVRRAGQPDFEGWLKTLSAPQSSPTPGRP